MRALAISVAAVAALTTQAATVGHAARAARTPVVVVDAGHDLHANLATEPIGPGSHTMKIKDGGGTSGILTHTPEAVITLAVALRLEAALKRSGVRVVMTRTTNSHVSMGNVERANIANRAHANLFIRIHADGSTDATSAGAHTLYPASISGWTDDVYNESLDAARLVQTQLVKAERFPDLGLDPRSDITGFNWSDVPVILPEIGFLTNPTEDRILSASPGQSRAALGLCRGVIAFVISRSQHVQNRCR